MNESFPKELEAHCYSYGTDKSGRPVQYNVYSHIDPAKLLSDEESIQKFIRWRVKLMEQTVSEQLDFENGIEDIVHVHDYSGVQLLRMDSKFKAAMLRIIRVFGDYYPEMLSTKYFINVPKVRSPSVLITITMKLLARYGIDLLKASTMIFDEKRDCLIRST